MPTASIDSRRFRHLENSIRGMAIFRQKLTEEVSGTYAADRFSHLEHAAGGGDHYNDQGAPLVTQEGEDNFADCSRITHTVD